MAAECINVLLIGRSKSGKSTIVRTMIENLQDKNNENSLNNSGQLNYLSYTSANNKPYHIYFNKVGENEFGSPDNCLDEIILNINKNPTWRNIVCLVSKAGNTNLTDMNYFRQATEILKQKYSKITMLVLTHCDEYDDKGLDEFEENISKHTNSKPVYEYCAQGLQHMGAIDEKKLRVYPEVTRKEIIAEKQDEISMMCQNLISRFTTYADTIASNVAVAPVLITNSTQLPSYDQNDIGSFTELMNGLPEITDINMNNKNNLSKYIPENSKPRKSRFKITNSRFINVLVIGRSKNGKSTLINTLKNPQRAIDNEANYESTLKTLTLFDDTSGHNYHLNIIELPNISKTGFFETSSKSDKEKLIFDCIRNDVTVINSICIVTEAGKTLGDCDTFQKIVEIFGHKCSQISMMVVTHCDEFELDRQAQIIEQIQRHPNTNKYVKYCKLGIFPMGAIDLNMVNSVEEAMRSAYVESKLDMIERMRDAVINKFIACANCGVRVHEIQHDLQGSYGCSLQ